MRCTVLKSRLTAMGYESVDTFGATKSNAALA